MSVCWSILYVFLALCMFIPCTNCSKRGCIAKPRGIKWHIIDDALVLTWEYKRTAMIPKGLYIHVQEAPWDGILGPMSYVHVKDPTAHSIDIRGLKPKSRYIVKIVAYSEKRSKSSRTIRIPTKKLEFLKAKEFKATAITDTNAMFTWKHEQENIINDLQFKINCDGQLKYHDQDGKEVKESSKFEYLTTGGSYLIEEYKATTLTPNILYTCSIVTVAGVNHESIPDTKIEFMTLSGKPLAPSPPKVVITSAEKKLPQYAFEVDLYPTSDLFGPISHYIVYAVPVTRSDHVAATMSFTPIITINKLPIKAVSAHLASTVTDKLPFIVGTYEPDKFPTNLVFDGSSMTLDFKPDTHYAFVVGAFTQTDEDSSEIKYSLSSLSNPPVYIGPDMTEEWVHDRMPVAKRFASTIIMTLVVSIVIFTVIVFVIVTLAYKKQRHQSIMFDEESDVGFSSNRWKNRNGKMLFKVLPKYAYHKLETNSSGEFHTRVDIVKKTSQQDNLELRPQLYSIATPPDSPRQHANRPTSPLIQSKREQIELPQPHGSLYSDSLVTTHINPIEDRLPFGRPFTPRKPYVPSNIYTPSYYSQTHPPGTPRPLLGPPEPPPLPSAIRVSIKEGYVMPKEGMPKRTLVKVLENNERRRQKQQQKKATEEGGDGILNSNSSTFIIDEIISDNEEETDNEETDNEGTDEEGTYEDANDYNEKTYEDASMETYEETYEDAPMGTYEETQEDTPMETYEDAPMGTYEETYEDAPMGTYEETYEDATTCSYHGQYKNIE